MGKPAWRGWGLGSGVGSLARGGGRDGRSERPIFVFKTSGGHSGPVEAGPPALADSAPGGVGTPGTAPAALDSQPSPCTHSRGAGCQSYRPAVISVLGSRLGSRTSTRPRRAHQTLLRVGLKCVPRGWGSEWRPTVGHLCLPPVLGGWTPQAGTVGSPLQMRGLRTQGLGETGESVEEFQRETQTPDCRPPGIQGATTGGGRETP